MKYSEFKEKVLSVEFKLYFNSAEKALYRELARIIGLSPAGCNCDEAYRKIQGELYDFIEKDMDTVLTRMVQLPDGSVITPRDLNEENIKKVYEAFGDKYFNKPFDPEEPKVEETVEAPKKRRGRQPKSAE